MVKPFDKQTVQALGVALIIIGILLFLLGLLVPPDASTLVPGAFPGCPLPWDWWIPRASLVSGIGLIITGVILVILAGHCETQAKNRPGRWVARRECLRRRKWEEGYWKGNSFDDQNLTSYFFS